MVWAWNRVILMLRWLEINLCLFFTSKGDSHVKLFLQASQNSRRLLMDVCFFIFYSSSALSAPNRIDRIDAKLVFESGAWGGKMWHVSTNTTWPGDSPLADSPKTNVSTVVPASPGSCEVVESPEKVNGEEVGTSPNWCFGDFRIWDLSSLYLNDWWIVVTAYWLLVNHSLGQDEEAVEGAVEATPPGTPRPSISFQMMRSSTVRLSGPLLKRSGPKETHHWETLYTIQLVDSLQGSEFWGGGFRWTIDRLHARRIWWFKVIDNGKAEQSTSLALTTASPKPHSIITFCINEWFNKNRRVRHI